MSSPSPHGCKIEREILIMCQFYVGYSINHGGLRTQKGRGRVQASNTFPLRITHQKLGGVQIACRITYLNNSWTTPYRTEERILTFSPGSGNLDFWWILMDSGKCLFILHCVQKPST